VTTTAALGICDLVSISLWIIFDFSCLVVGFPPLTEMGYGVFFPRVRIQSQLFFLSRSLGDNLSLGLPFQPFSGHCYPDSICSKPFAVLFFNPCFSPFSFLFGKPMGIELA